MLRIFLTHPAGLLEAWYGRRPLEHLETVGEVVLNERDEVLNAEELVEASRGCQVIISDRLTTAPGPLFESSGDLVAYLRCAMDLRSVDIEAASRAGVLVTRAGPGFSHSVAEWIVGQLVNLSRHLPRYAASYWAGQSAQPIMGRQLSGMTVGVLGYGNISKTLAPILNVMGMNVIVYDPANHPDPSIARSVDFDTLLEEAEAVICLVPLTPETESLFNADVFSRMRKGAMFINAARGGVVDEDALSQALDCGQIGCAALDVGSGTDNYPPMALASKSAVIASPHVGGLVPEAVESQAMDTVAQATALKAGRIPEGAVNEAQAFRLQRLGITGGASNKT